MRDAATSGGASLSKRLFRKTPLATAINTAIAPNPVNPFATRER